jgi:hypothetical protein
MRLAAIGVLPLIALAGLLGGTPAETGSARNDTADLFVRSPHILRNGLLFETRIEVLARRPIDDAVIAIPAQHWRDFTINSMIPAATEEEYKDGEYRFHFDRLEAGDRLQFKIDGQVNPPHFGRDVGRIRLLDDEREVIAVRFEQMVLP